MTPEDVEAIRQIIREEIKAAMAPKPSAKLPADLDLWTRACRAWETDPTATDRYMEKYELPTLEQVRHA